MQHVHLTTKPNSHGGITWVNDAEHPIIIIDGRIEFFSKDLGSSFEFFVKGTKGRGVADADRLTNLNTYHVAILDLMLDRHVPGELTGESIRLHIKYKIQHHQITTFKMFKDANWIRPISELLRRGLLTQDDSSPKRYTLDRTRAYKCLETRKFES